MFSIHFISLGLSRSFFLYQFHSQYPTLGRVPLQGKEPGAGEQCPELCVRNMKDIGPLSEMVEASALKLGEGITFYATYYIGEDR